MTLFSKLNSQTHATQTLANALQRVLAHESLATGCVRYSALVETGSISCFKNFGKNFVHTRGCIFILRAQHLWLNFASGVQAHIPWSHHIAAHVHVEALVPALSHEHLALDKMGISLDRVVGCLSFARALSLPVSETFAKVASRS